MKYLATIPLTLIIFYAILLLGIPISVQADETECPPETICIENPFKYGTLDQIIKAITNLLRTIALGIGTIMVIISGIQIMTAGGNEEQLKKGKKTMTWTVVGVAIVVAVDFITGLVTELLAK